MRRVNSITLANVTPAGSVTLAGGLSSLTLSPDGTTPGKTDIKLATIGSTFTFANIVIKLGTLQQTIEVRKAGNALAFSGGATQLNYQTGVYTTAEVANPTTPSWFTLSTDGTNDVGTSYTQPNAASLTPIYFKTLTNTAAPRSGAVYLSRATQGRAKAYIGQANLVIPPGSGAAPSGFNTYVGAFWKKDQTGERIIRIEVAGAANFGPWSAFVHETDDNWTTNNILLTTTLSADPGITYNASTENPADMNINDATYQVTSGTQAVSGTISSAPNDNIVYFRIGLNSTYTPTSANPARYATIVLTYGNPVKVQKIYLRQGEDPDYLIHPSDVTTNAAYVKRFSPYNLTAAGMSDAVKYADVATNGGVFANFPTQVGAHFKFMGPAGQERRAWHPTRMDIGIADFPYTYGSGAWSASYEICPLGYEGKNYRRPTTATMSATTISEFANSLMTNPAIPLASNSAWGYYADGYFDRRAIQTPNGVATEPKTGVNKDSHEAAYIGRLFYNDITGSAREKASIFFPAVGYRGVSSSTIVDLAYAGSYCNYWASTTSSTPLWVLYMTTGRLGFGVDIDFIYDYETERTLGFSIRCVVN